jgi:hypothetical protein
MNNIINFLQEKLVINKDIKLSERKPQNKEEEACKTLADICKKTIFKGINLKENDFKGTGELCKVEKAFNKDEKYAKEFYKERASVLKFSIHTADSKALKSIELDGNFDNKVFVTVQLDNDGEISNVLLTSNIKDWLLY